MVTAYILLKNGDQKIFYANDPKEIYPAIEKLWSETKKCIFFPSELKDLRQGRETLHDTL